MGVRVKITGNFLRIYDDVTNKDVLRRSRSQASFFRSGDNFVFFNNSAYGTSEDGQRDNVLGVNVPAILNETPSQQSVFDWNDLLKSDGNPWASGDELDDFLSSKLSVGTVSPVLYDYIKTTNLGFVGKGIGPFRTVTVTIDNSIVEQFKINDELYFDAAPGYDYESGDLLIIVDYVAMGAEVNKEVQWEIEYLTHDHHEVISGTTGTLQSGDIVLPSTQYESEAFTFVIPAAQIKEEIHFRLRRIAINDGDDPAVRPAVVHVHTQYRAKLVQ